MKVKIKETGNVEELVIIDSNSGVNYVKDFLGNYGAFLDGQFVLDGVSDTYVADESTYKWWVEVLSDHQNLNDRVARLTEIHGSDVQDTLNSADAVDLEDEAAVYNRILDETYGVNAGK